MVWEFYKIMALSMSLDCLTEVEGGAVPRCDKYARNRRCSDPFAGLSSEEIYGLMQCNSRIGVRSVGSSGMDDRDKRIYNSLGDTSGSKGKVRYHDWMCSTCKPFCNISALSCFRFVRVHMFATRRIYTSSPASLQIPIIVLDLVTFPANRLELQSRDMASMCIAQSYCQHVLLYVLYTLHHFCILPCSI